MIWRYGLGVAAVLLWGTAAQAREVPADPDAFARYFANSVAAALPGDSVIVGSNGAFTLISPEGAHLGLDAERVRKICFAPKEDTASCVEYQVKAAAGMFTPGKTGEFRAQLALNGGGVWNAPFTKVAIAWARPSFGTFDEECYKSAPDFVYPANAWDGMVRQLDDDGIGALCEADTRAALGPLEPAAPDADGISTIMGRFEASRALFLDAWKPLSGRPGGLLIALPLTGTVLYAKDSPGMADTLSRRALAVRKPHLVSHEALSIDVYRWSASGWQRVTSHAMADEVAAAIAQAMPGASVEVEDASSIGFWDSRNTPQDINLGHLAEECPARSALCDSKAAALAARVVKKLANPAP
jgi:hypothetical protein